MGVFLQQPSAGLAARQCCITQNRPTHPMILKILAWFLIASALLLETYIVSDRFGWGLATTLVILGNLIVLAAFQIAWHRLPPKSPPDAMTKKLLAELARIPHCKRCDAPNDVDTSDWWACSNCGHEHEPK